MSATACSASIAATATPGVLCDCSYRNCACGMSVRRCWRRRAQHGVTCRGATGRARPIVERVIARFPTSVVYAMQLAEPARDRMARRSRRRRSERALPRLATPRGGWAFQVQNAGYWSADSAVFDVADEGFGLRRGHVTWSLSTTLLSTPMAASAPGSGSSHHQSRATSTPCGTAVRAALVHAPPSHLSLVSSPTRARLGPSGALRPP